MSGQTTAGLAAVLPEGWPRPRGYSDGIVAPAGARLVFIAGQIAWNEKHELVGEGDFAAQFRRALENVVAVVRAAGGGPTDLASLTVFVTKKEKYVEALKPVGAAWREVVGAHYPAMALVEVAGLLEPRALLEIQGIAALAGPAPGAGKRRIADALRSSLEGKDKK